MFKTKEIVVYPKYGITKIERIIDINFNNVKQQYYELKFANNLSVELPVDKAEYLGLRYPLSKKMMLEELQKLDIEFEPDMDLKIYNSSKFGGMLKTGKMSDAIELLRIFKWLIEYKKTKFKNLEVNEREIYQNLMEFIRSEVDFVLGKSYF